MTEVDVTGLRPLMFSIAYRMVGSVSEAEDIVQDAYLRLRGADGVRSPEAYAATVTTRLAIDHLRSARVRREAYVGSWLPEPLITGADGDPARRIELDESVSIAFLALLERLSPIERAVFLLREVFEYPYEDIAGVVDKEVANCRRIFARAKRHIEAERPRFTASREKQTELVQRFLAAATEGDVAGLEQLLADDVVFYGDGGGKAPSIKAPLHGKPRVLRLLNGLIRRGRTLGLRVEMIDVNGQPGVLLLDKDGRLFSVLTFEIGDGVIRAFRNVINPDKLRHLGPVVDGR